MIIDLPATTTSAVNRRLVDLRDEGGAVALGRVLTLVIEAPDDDLEAAIEAANDASREHPCRVVAIGTSSKRDQTRLDAEIRVGGDAGASEVVVLRPSGELLGHLDTLVIPLLLPDAPVVAWWPRVVPANPSRHQIGKIAARRITDTTVDEAPRESLRRLRETYTAGDTDLAWTRLTLWRGLLAAALDESPEGQVTRAEVEGEASHTSVDLLAAWFAEALDVPVTVTRLEGVRGITAARLWRGDEVVELSRPDGQVATLRLPGVPHRSIALPLRQLRECLSEELRRLDPDDVYGKVLTRGLVRVEG